eukprot:c5916_g1_i1.p1 GENE.c5916_g1_i1~~c5916_g1_i1.p1  ORF type:complete len:354 (+),score=59.00 c5916_g1_i1:99-1160(+)
MLRAEEQSILDSAIYKTGRIVKLVESLEKCVGDSSGRVAEETQAEIKSQIEELHQDGVLSLDPSWSSNDCGFVGNNRLARMFEPGTRYEGKWGEDEYAIEVYQPRAKDIFVDPTKVVMMGRHSTQQDSQAIEITYDKQSPGCLTFYDFQNSATANLNIKDAKIEGTIWDIAFKEDGKLWERLESSKRFFVKRKSENPLCTRARAILNQARAASALSIGEWFSHVTPPFPPAKFVKNFDMTKRLGRTSKNLLDDAYNYAEDCLARVRYCILVFHNLNQKSTNLSDLECWPDLMRSGCSRIAIVGVTNEIPGVLHGTASLLPKESSQSDIVEIVGHRCARLAIHFEAVISKLENY